MGFDTDRPPLPAPTESSTLDSADESIHIDDVDTNVSTNVSNRTDRTSYSVPDDGTPITINTTTPTKPHGGGTLRKKYPSQTSLLIEYFDVGTSEGPDQRRSSVRVRVTPSSRKTKKSSANNDHIQISQATRNHRKPSSTRRISLGSKSRDELIDTRSVDFSDISSLPPGDIELLPSFTDQDSDGGRFIPVPSDISSMPTDSMTGATEILPPARRRSRSLERDAVTDTLVSEAIKDTLKAPREHRSRSLSKDRITQRVMEKLQQQAAEGNLSSKPKERSSKSRETSRRRDDDLSSPRKSHRRRSRDVERTGGVSGTDSSVLSSNIDRRSGVSGTSSINNPKLLATVEDAIKRLILPELNALKEENRTSRNLDKFDRSNRDSTTLYEPAESTSSRDPKRRVSKSSSAPKLHSNKPKVVLNKDGDEPAITITGASSRKSDRRSSRSSISSFAESTATREEKSHRRKSRDKEGMSQRESALLGLAGAGLTAAALRHHTSREEKEEERKHRKHRSSRSIRSQSESISESLQEEEKRPKELVPPLPFNHSELIGGSELTRDSILSADTETKERPQSRSSASTGITGTGAETPLKQVPRGIASPSPLTPSRTPNALQQTLGSAQSNRSTGDVRQSTPKSERSYTSRAKGSTDAGLSAAAAAAKIRAIEQSQLPTSQYEIESDTQSGRGVSPIQSEASYRGDANTGSPRRFHSIRSGPSVSSLGDHFERRQSGLSIASLDSTASTKAARTRKRPQGVTLESKKSILNEPSTPTDTKEFFERNHKKNEQYRRELEESPLTPPPVNYNRLTQYTDDSVGGPDLDRDLKLDQDVRKVGSIPEYIHTPLAVESAVASLYDQTELSVRSSKMSSPVKKSTLSQVSNNPAYIQTDDVPTGQKWSSVRERAEALAQGRKVDDSPKQSIPRENSPRQSIAESEDAESINEPPRMHHSAMPGGHDDMPEIGYGMDDESDVTTNPSIIQGPIGGGGNGYRDRTDELLDMQEERDRTPTSFAKGAHLQRHDQQSPASFDDEHQATVEDDYDHPYPGENQYEQAGYEQSIRTPLSGQTGWKDEGYQSANQPEGYTPQNGKYSKMFDDGYDDEYDAMDLGDAEAFATRAKHDRHVSGNSHGMDSPLYDAATGKGIDHIQSKDIVALMDHLTVRDAQRNARDTEILVTLVRSAAEMRTQLDDLKQFIKVQDNMIMNTTDKRVNLAEQRILGGPRPQPLTPPRVNRNQSEEEIETKKKSVFRRALKGLSAGKGDGDIKHIESMLVQLLSEVEGLKQVNQLNLDQQQARTNSVTSFENNRRASGDAGYEPEGRANTASSPNQSGYFSIPSQSRRVQDLHSGYDVIPTTRISTVREESDEEYEERSPGYENTERMTTPTQEAFQEKRASLGTPPQASRAARDSTQSQEDTPKRKHKSNSSSIFGIPKISRWSKTTASTNPESLPRHSGSGDKRPYSTHSIHSRSSSQDDYYDEEEPYEQHGDDRLRSSTSLAREDQGSIRSVRSPSPLIPEDSPYEMEDPKYQAHRNSLNLQHPQPRPGPTGRHQNNLETQAQIFQPMRLSVGSPDFDQWGSMPSLARNRLSGMSAPHASNLSPISSDGSYSQASEHQAGRPSKVMDDGPLVPPPQTLAGFGQTRQMYSSPNEFGSQGALTPLAPIAEVRYSLETDRGHRMTPTASPRASTSSLRTMSDLSAPQRKITGPRAMGSKSPQPSSPLQHSDTVVRRKPIADDLESLESYRSSLDSEIF